MKHKMSRANVNEAMDGLSIVHLHLLKHFLALSYQSCRFHLCCASLRPENEHIYTLLNSWLLD